ncbi:phasin protein [Roseibium hamelinense]|uniref:Phasin protein n=1 Tax=Roseibium hamelinense TaxID=150831 RepID=A0A562SHP2_9HYPH|nr:phasin family protein [Roseibium hamelinense]TWI80837.1 phasin protein [Roseibium hamelinense]
MTKTSEKITKAIVENTEEAATRGDELRQAAAGVASAVSAGSKAYAVGVGEIGRTIFRFGKETLDEAMQHGKASLNAKSMREMAELQVSFAQHRIETSAAHAQEVVELARAKSEDVIEPIVDLVKSKKAA